MATLLKDDGGIPIPQYANAQGDFESSHGADGALYVHDGQLATILDSVSNIMNEVDRHGVDLSAIKSDIADIKAVLGTLPSNNASTVYDLLDAIRTGVGANGVYLDNISDAIGTVGTSDPTALSLLADMLTALGTLVAALASGGTFSNMASDVNTIATQSTSIATDTGSMSTAVSNINTNSNSITSDVADIKVSAANIDTNTTPSNP